MNIKKLMALPAVPLLAISMAACGNDSDAEVTTTQAEVTTEAPTTVESTEPAVVETTTETETTVDDDAKPSKEEVATGLRTIMTPMFEQIGGSDAASTFGDPFYACVTDEIYDVFPADTLRGIADGDATTPISAENQQTLIDAAAPCAQRTATN